MKKLKAGAALLVFKAGEISHAVPLDSVDKVEFAVEVTPLADAPRIVLGVIDWRGTILPVLSLARRLGLPDKPVTSEERLIIARTNRRRLALLVEEVTDVTFLSDAEAAAAANVRESTGRGAGAVKLNGDVVLIHDLDLFLDEDDSSALEDALGRKENARA